MDRKGSQVGVGITLEAAEWLLRLDENCGPECRSEFLAWLKRSPRHMDEFLMVEAAYRTLHQFDPQRRAEIDALVENASAEIVQLRGNSAAPPAEAARDGRSRVMRRNWLRRPHGIQRDLFIINRRSRHTKWARARTEDAVI